MISRFSRYSDGKDNTCVYIYIFHASQVALQITEHFVDLPTKDGYFHVLLYVYKRVNFQATVKKIYIYIYNFNSWFSTWIFMMFQWFLHRLFMRNTTHNCSSLGCCQSLGVLFNTPRPIAGKSLLGCKPRTSYSHAGVYRILKKHITRFGICLNTHIVSTSGWL